MYIYVYNKYFPQLLQRDACGNGSAPKTTEMTCRDGIV